MTKPTKEQQPAPDMIKADPTEVVTILVNRIAELEKDKAVLTAALHAQQK
ncbi:hypothetical protein [Levilactobacillus brevis]|nr:hypothetical protein [Levilactobacillus brevis]MUV40576.1 hypothetical protein [Levilactobacillus brevis]